MLTRLACKVCLRALVCGLLGALALAGCRESAESTRVLDDLEVLSQPQLESIDDYLRWVRSERGIDYRVVVTGAGDVDLLSEAVATFERLEVGAAEQGRGLLLLIRASSGEARVEVGYALEGRLRDVEASSMIRDLLAPYVAAGQVAQGIEASVERLVEILDLTLDEPSAGIEITGSGGAGATEELFAGIDRLTPGTEAELREILVPQARPEDCVLLEIALMRKGIYYRDAPMYDQAWRRANRPSLPARRLKELAREWAGPFSVARDGDHAITYYTGDKALRWGPQFLRRTDDGWIVDASLVARNIVYDFSNRYWYALDGDYPYLVLIREVYPMIPVALQNRGTGWAIDTAKFAGS